MHSTLHRFLLTSSTLAVLALFAGSGLAQGGSMELTVVDQDGDKLRDVQITATPEGGSEVVATAETNRRGVAKADFPAEGFYTLTLNADGFPEQTARIEIREGMSTAVSATLYSEDVMVKQQAVDAFNAGVTALQSNQEEKAYQSFRKAAELDPSLADAHRLAAILSADRDELEVTREALEKFLELQPGNVAAVAPAAYVVYRADGREDELPAVREALRQANFAGDIAARVFNEGVGELREENLDEARALFEEALLLEPDLLVAHRSLAAMEFNRNDFEAAIPHIENLLERAPEHRDGARMGFFSYAALGRDSEAVEAGKTWASKDPNVAEEISGQAVQYFENDELERARSLMDLVLQIDADSPYAHYTMGRVLAGAGEIEQAKEHLRKFLELDPDHPEAGSARSMLEGL